MGSWIIWWFVIALVTTAAVIACMIALVRQAMVLGRAARRLQEDAQPVVTEIIADGSRAATRASSLQPPRRSRS